MSIREEVIQLISHESIYPASITEDTNLYQDLHFDSLTFVNLLIGLEERYHITIELPEMERCLIVGQLISIIEVKRKEKSV